MFNMIQKIFLKEKNKLKGSVKNVFTSHIPI